MNHHFVIHQALLVTPRLMRLWFVFLGLEWTAKGVPLLQWLRILQVSRTDVVGGAAKIAWNLFQSYQARGYISWLAVGHKDSEEPDVLVLPNRETQGKWGRFWGGLHSRLEYLNHVRGGWRLISLIDRMSGLAKSVDRYWGIEDFRSPGSWHLLDLTPKRPNIVHCHNLHGDYFDLRVLPWLSQQVPVVLTLHDTWLLSGHCYYSFECERWKTGCGRCPDLNIYPAIRRDATAYNWLRKQKIYSKSRLYVATPSRWLMGKVEQSMLGLAVREARVIPNGVDLSIFHPADKQSVRARLRLPQDAKVLLFTAVNARTNQGKDYQTMRAAVGQVAMRLPAQKLIFIALGDEAPTERAGQTEIRFIPYQDNPGFVAQYYQAADLYLHGAKADNFPTTVLESLACGRPVVATAVGGIPEQVKGLDFFPSGLGTTANRYGKDRATGVLVPLGDVEQMTVAIVQLLTIDSLCRHLGENAARDARERFDLVHQADDYLQWYGQVVEEFAPNSQKSNQSGATVSRRAFLNMRHAARSH
jgi:glycosyltransferase involved in cell wall biosynthesis